MNGSYRFENMSIDEKKEGLFDEIDDSLESPINKKAVVATGVGIIGCMLLVSPFLTPALRRHILPYVPATDSQIEDVLALCKIAMRSTKSQKYGNRLIDLGSGDGRVVFAALRRFPDMSAAGVELNQWLVLYSRWRAWRKGVRNRSVFTRQDLWKVSLKDFDFIIIFGVKEMMRDLEKKMIHDLSPNAAVISTRFALPTWKVSEHRGLAWLYYRSDQTSE
uniref:Methyltransferase domain-containing protein n=1 Tax=Timspurckia oligopyrenoides TaxID=708627 RepID=A0A7S1ER67_9RHOD|mmetsp:Transcript_1773/g.3176  ORF Transcript_1773/g.3176 Transcript_1773/m.3176 type:complete len:220 (+) Transcript_1773:906-1565(+)|eukprot:CAMPEP_0182447994 /NCGR_PEP_ID=MMETSP1172-20130603/22460_1 /TAXON_ID=708627 /ORGANISM="Timspurckia oligopyrenoides, Strain CCMP3278" /LENGTH=219 /DNA_ID=CAMNT_0024644673 /DNA_START=883 /DNA_END=1542 /DNA_ORIENTATION=+